MTAPEWITTHDGYIRMVVRVVPRARRSAIGEVRGGALAVRLAAPPVDGAANEELVRLIADAVDVRRSAVRITSGHSARKKTIEIVGLSAQAAAHRLLGNPEAR